MPTLRSDSAVKQELSEERGGWVHRPLGSVWDSVKPEAGSGPCESHVGGAEDGMLRELGRVLEGKRKGAACLCPCGSGLSSPRARGWENQKQGLLEGPYPKVSVSCWDRTLSPDL